MMTTLIDQRTADPLAGYGPHVLAWLDAVARTEGLAGIRFELRLLKALRHRLRSKYGIPTTTSIARSISSSPA